jgi:hypothetical protein
MSGTLTHVDRQVSWLLLGRYSSLFLALMMQPYASKLAVMCNKARLQNERILSTPFSMAKFM